MSTQEVANKLIEYCKTGQWSQATDELYADTIVSYEPEGSNSPRKVEGKDGKKMKDQIFADMTEEFHEFWCSEPIVTGNFFTLSMGMDVTMKNFGRMKMEEICVYRLNSEGKIDYEEFFFSVEQPA